MPFIIQFIGAAGGGVLGYLIGGMITMRVGDEQFQTDILFLMIGALSGYFIARAFMPMFLSNDEDTDKNGKK